MYSNKLTPLIKCAMGQGFMLSGTTTARSQRYHEVQHTAIIVRLFASAVAVQRQSYVVDSYVYDHDHLEVTFCDGIASRWTTIKDPGYEVVASWRRLCFIKLFVAAIFVQNLFVVKGDNRNKVGGDKMIQW